MVIQLKLLLSLLSLHDFGVLLMNGAAGHAALIGLADWKTRRFVHCIVFVWIWLNNEKTQQRLITLSSIACAVYSLVLYYCLSSFKKTTNSPTITLGDMQQWTGALFLVQKKHACLKE